MAEGVGFGLNGLGFRISGLGFSDLGALVSRLYMM